MKEPWCQLWLACQNVPDIDAIPVSFGFLLSPSFTYPVLVWNSLGTYLAGNPAFLFILGIFTIHTSAVAIIYHSGPIGSQRESVLTVSRFLKSDGTNKFWISEFVAKVSLAKGHHIYEDQFPPDCAWTWLICAEVKESETNTSSFPRQSSKF